METVSNNHAGGWQGASWLIDAKEAARLCGIGRSTWLRLHASGRCPMPVKLGRRTLWNREDLINWINAGCPSRDKWEVKKKLTEKR